MNLVAYLPWRWREIVDPANANIRGMLLRDLARRNRNAFWQSLAAKLPPRAVYFTSIYLIARATTGRYGNTVVPELAAMEAIKRYGDDHGIDRVPGYEEPQPYDIVAEALKIAHHELTTLHGLYATDKARLELDYRDATMQGDTWRTFGVEIDRHPQAFQIEEAAAIKFIANAQSLAHKLNRPEPQDRIEALLVWLDNHYRAYRGRLL